MICLEQETKGVPENTKSVVKGNLTPEVRFIIHAMNSDRESIPGGMI